MTAGRYVELETGARTLLAAQPDCGFAWQLLGVALGKQGKDPVAALASAARLLPDDAVAHLNLGNALARVGRLPEARESFDRALELRPEFAEAHNNLGHVFLELGQFDAARQSCRRALAARPQYAQAHENLGRASLKLGRLDEAMAAFRHALLINPELAEAHVNLANVQRSLGRIEDAEAAYRSALRIKPDFVAAHAELGTALRLQRRAAESEASCRAALALDPNSTAALVVLAELRADAGLFGEAEALLRRVLSIDPESAEAWAGLAYLRRMGVADADWLASARKLGQNGLTPQRELLLRFAIGKYLDDVMDFDAAFASYRRANELSKACGPPHDPAALTRTVDAIIHAFAQPWIRRERGAVSSSARPVFIVGMLRSGTTLAEQILATHPEVSGAGELAFWSSRGGAQMAAPSDAALVGLGNAYLELLRSLSPDAVRVVDKMPTNYLFLGLIHAALPKARIIHMQRHPIDTCLSIYFQHFEAGNTYANDLDDLARYYRDYRRLMAHWRRALPPQSLLEVPYEGLVGDTELWSRRMLDFIGLPWDPRCLDFHETARTVVTASKWQVRQKISAASVGRWRQYEKFIGPLRPLPDTGHL